MKNKITVKRITRNAVMLALLCIVGMFSIPLGANIKLSLQLLMVFLICLTVEHVVDALIITSLYLALGLFLPIYAGFSVGVTPTFGYVISFVVISPIIFYLNKIPKLNPAIRMFIACFVGLLVCYTIGTIFMMLYLSMDLAPTLLISVVPYIPFDIAKIIVAILTTLILSKQSKTNK